MKYIPLVSVDRGGGDFRPVSRWGHPHHNLYLVGSQCYSRAGSMTVLHTRLLPGVSVQSLKINICTGQFF